jgi:hypothetical protein
MDEATREPIVDPFFTTKEKERQGTQDWSPPTRSSPIFNPE